LYEQTNNGKFRTALEALRRSIDLQPRNSEGGLWYYSYPDWSYLDGMYSFAPFLTEYTLASNSFSSTAIEDVVQQLDLLWRHCYDNKTGFLRHGYDAHRKAAWADPITGTSRHVWGRSLGWFAMALMDTISLLPPQAAFQERRKYICDRFETQVYFENICGG
jgi:rhamnogalacturonyl hydrolase YesR